jgi:hypothetical protein
MGKIVVESPLINSLFKCTLCHGLIRSPTVINECLHRCKFINQSINLNKKKLISFLILVCKLCITNYFEKNNNTKCPTCYMTIVNPLDTLK